MRYCLALDLKDDPDAISRYEAHHERIWPEVAAYL
ncbi:L-rhamnose mutarotase, partial [Burkholderia pseudomallei]